MVSPVAVITVLLIVPFAITEGKVYNKCELARKMFSLGVPKSELPDWVCLAQYESSFNTTQVHTNSNKSKDWGIFQINDRYWCKPSDGRSSLNACNIACSSLVTNSIDDAIGCARRIKSSSKNGFGAWYAWSAKCQKSKPSISDCF